MLAKLCLKLNNEDMSKESFEVSVKGVMPTSNGCALFLGNEQNICHICRSSNWKCNKYDD